MIPLIADAQLTLTIVGLVLSAVAVTITGLKLLHTISVGFDRVQHGQVELAGDVTSLRTDFNSMRTDFKETVDKVVEVEKDVIHLYAVTQVPPRVFNHGSS